MKLIRFIVGFISFFMSIPFILLAGFMIFFAAGFVMKIKLGFVDWQSCAQFTVELVKKEFRHIDMLALIIWVLFTIYYITS